METICSPPIVPTTLNGQTKIHRQVHHSTLMGSPLKTGELRGKDQEMKTRLFHMDLSIFTVLDL